MGCDIPRFIAFRSLPVNVWDDLMRAEILPTMWPRCRISGYERVFHSRLMTVIRSAMVMQATCHELTPASVDSVYPRSVNAEYRVWINELIRAPGGRSNLAAVLAAQIASPGTQVTIMFIATVLEEAEYAAHASNLTLQDCLGSRTIADLVEQFANEESHTWLNSHDFFRGDNGDFATIREVSESPHDIIMGGSTSSDDATAMET